MPKTTFEKSGGNPILDAIANHPLKRSLQFTGWLQYIPTLVLLGISNLVLRALVVIIASFELNKLESTVNILVTVWQATSICLITYELACCKYGFRPVDKPLNSIRERLTQKASSSQLISVFHVINDRRSVRSFHAQKLTPEDRQFVLAAAAASLPSKLGSKPIRFVYVGEPLLVWPCIHTKEFLVALAPKQYDKQSVMDVGYTMEAVVLQAHRRGIATCVIGPGTDQERAQQALGTQFNETTDHIILSVALGYESYYVPCFIRVITSTIRTRLPLSRLFFRDAAMTRPVPVLDQPYSQFVQCYEACRWAPSSYNAQPVRCVVHVSDNERENASNSVVDRVDFFMYGPSKYYGVVAVGIWMCHWEMGCSELHAKGKFVQLTDAERGLKGSGEVAVDTFYAWSWIFEK